MGHNAHMKHIGPAVLSKKFLTLFSEHFDLIYPHPNPTGNIDFINQT